GETREPDQRPDCGGQPRTDRRQCPPGGGDRPGSRISRNTGCRLGDDGIRRSLMVSEPPHRNDRLTENEMLWLFVLALLPVLCCGGGCWFVSVMGPLLFPL